jgi:hypothetical protein
MDKGRSALQDNHGYTLTSGEQRPGNGTHWLVNEGEYSMISRHHLIPKLLAASLATLLSATGFCTEPPPAAPNGITLPEGYRDWRVIASSHRVDNNTLRVILGNDTAIAAARSGNTRPWPDGTILGKLVWKDASHAHWEKAVVPGEFVHAEFMLKDSARYPATGGWGYARWKGMDQQPYGEDATFVQECHGCHLPMQDNDFVFTHPAATP